MRCVLRIAGVSAWLGGTIFFLDSLKNNPELLIKFFKFSFIPAGVAIVSVAMGSIKITMRVETVVALDEVVERYNTGQLKEDFKKVLITEKLKNLASGGLIELSVEINEKELMEIRKLLVEEEAIKETVESFCVLPPKPSHQIIKRENEVETLLRKMKHKDTNKITVTYLSGNPGCGKSELARQVGEKFHTNIAVQRTGAKFVFTFNASCIETLFHSYIEFTRLLGCPKESIARDVRAKDASMEEKIMQLRGLSSPKLEKYSSWMMIVDNVRDLELVSRYFPHKQDETRGNGQVLVTTQDNRAIANYSKCTLFFSINAGMSTTDACKTLNEIGTFSTEQAAISELVKALDFQPLALASAAIWTRSVCSRKSSMTWTKFLEEHKSRAEPDAKTGLTYSASMKAAVMMALEKEMSDSILMVAFQFLSVMAPEPISLEYITQYVKICKRDTNDEVVAARVSSSSLLRISADGSAVSVHQVVHDCLQTVMLQNKEFNMQFLELLKMLKAFPLLSPYNTEQIEQIFETSSLLIHFLAFTRKLQHYVEESLSSETLSEISLEDKDTANSLSLVGDICYKNCYYIASEICNGISTFIKKSYSNKNFEPLVAMMKKLALINDKAGKHQEARKSLETALHIQEKAYGSDDIRLSTTQYELGVSHGVLGEDKEAKRYFQRALGIQGRAYGNDDPCLASTLNNLGVSHSNVGEHEEAKTCFERALRIQVKAYGNDDPLLATTLNELGFSYRGLGEHQEARKCFERALAIQEKAYANDDIRLSTTQYELGLSHSNVGEHEEAKTCFERALRIQEKAYGKDDSRLASTLNNLGVSHSNVGEHEETKTCFERALRIQEKAYGNDDPRLATTLRNLGISHSNIGDDKEAKRYFQRELSLNLCCET